MSQLSSEELAHLRTALADYCETNVASDRREQRRIDALFNKIAQSNDDAHSVAVNASRIAAELPDGTDAGNAEILDGVANAAIAMTAMEATHPDLWEHHEEKTIWIDWESACALAADTIAKGLHGVHWPTVLKRLIPQA